MIPVIDLWLLDEPHGDIWDRAFLWDTLRRSEYIFEEKYHHINEGAVVLLHGEAHADKADRVNLFISTLDWVLLIITSDEFAKFPIQDLSHPNMEIWGQYRNDVRRLPIGYTPHTRPNLPSDPPAKVTDWFFAGQVVNQPRKDLMERLRARDDGRLMETEGFSQGMSPEAYIKNMCEAKVVPAPVGSNWETFRYYEALECGAYPLSDLEDLDMAIQRFPHNQKVSSWIERKYYWADMLTDTVMELSGISPHPSQLTAIIPTSVIPSHPDTSIIEQTINSIRERLDCRILVCIDGLREEQKHRKSDYDEYVRRLLWKINLMDDVMPLYFAKHTHQVGMLGDALETIRTPYILWCEHDTPLDGDIPFKELVPALEELDIIRFYPEKIIEPQHQHLMVGKKTINGQPFTITSQYSARPHMARADYYREMLSKFGLKEDGNYKKSMVEDLLHGKVISGQEDPEEWGTHRIGIYHPEGNLQRSTHSDGREGDSKFEDKFEL